MDLLNGSRVKGLKRDFDTNIASGRRKELVYKNTVANFCPSTRKSPHRYDDVCYVWKYISKISLKLSCMSRVGGRVFNIVDFPLSELYV